MGNILEIANLIHIACVVQMNFAPSFFFCLGLEHNCGVSLYVIICQVGSMHAVDVKKKEDKRVPHRPLL